MARLRQERVPAFLEGDRARWFAAHARAAQRAGKVSRVDLEIAGQGEKLVVNAVIELRCVFSRTPWQVGAPDRTDEERIAGEHEPRLMCAPQICDQEADA